MYVFETKTTFFHDQKNNKEKKSKNKHSLYKHNLTRTIEHRFIQQLVFNGSINKSRSLSFSCFFLFHLFADPPRLSILSPIRRKVESVSAAGVLFPSVRSHSSPLALSCSARCAVCLARALLGKCVCCCYVHTILAQPSDCGPLQRFFHSRAHQSQAA